MNWAFDDIPEPSLAAIEHEFGLTRPAAAALYSAVNGDRQRVPAFLYPSLRKLSPPQEIPGINEAVSLLLETTGPVVLFGDYDVDGLTSLCQFQRLLQALHIECKPFIPNRFRHGYGITEEGLKEALSGTRPALFVALDCGTNSFHLLAEGLARETAILVVDHHQPDRDQPSASAIHRSVIVNPHLALASGHAGDFCTSGLVFRLSQALCRALLELGDVRYRAIDLGAHLEFATLGTVADLVPLSGDNRILVANGLRRLPDTGNLGIRALADVAGLGNAVRFEAADIGFRLGPRINAGGRLEDAALPLALLNAEEPAEASEIARQLDLLNRERQDLEKYCCDKAEVHLEEQIAAGAIGLVAFSSEWHQGIVGIAAGRFARRFHRPCLILGGDGDNRLKGSGRAPDGYDLVRILERTEPQPNQWGGHPAAVGLGLDSDRAEAFREGFDRAAREIFGDSPLEPVLSLAYAIRPETISEKLFNEVATLQPFGRGNEEPVFALALPRGLAGIRTFGRGHFRARAPDLSQLEPTILAWNLADSRPREGQPTECAVKLKTSEWQGRPEHVLELLDWRPL